MGQHSVNATAASLLGFLHRGPMTGWELVAMAEEEIGDFWSLTRSQVYRELTAMAEAGLIKAGERGPRDRQPYSITDDGRKAFQDWVTQPHEEESIRFPLLLTALFGSHIPPVLLAKFLADHRGAHARRLERYEAVAAAYEAAPDEIVVDPYRRSTLDFGLNYERAVLSWFDSLPEAVWRRALSNAAGAAEPADGAPHGLNGTPSDRAPAQQQPTPQDQ